MVNEETKEFLEAIPVKERTEHQHFLLIQMYGSTYQYLVSMQEYQKFLLEDLERSGFE